MITWVPPSRERRSGHRVSSRPGYRPVETRSLGDGLRARFWAVLAEVPMRKLARLDVTWEVPEED